MTPPSQFISLLSEEKRASDLMKVLDSLWAMPSAPATHEPSRQSSLPSRPSVSVRIAENDK